MRFNEKVRMLAEERGMTQADFARKTGMPTSQVTYIFSGRSRNPRVDTAMRCADALGVTMGELIDGVTFGEE